MKKSWYMLCIGLVLFATSCTKTDNYDGPNAALSGKVMDATTGEPLLSGQGEYSIRLWETSWGENPSPQDLAIKQNGSYDNKKLFQATYDLQPYGGPFWPVNKTTDFELTGSGTQDFTVTPYLKITDVQWELVDGVHLKISCKLGAPIPAGLPQVMEVRPFVSLTEYCGEGNRIDAYYKDEYRVQINKNWSEIGNVETGIGNELYTIPNNLPLKSGYTYYVRIGAKVRDTFEKFNYSEIVEIKIP